MRLLLLLTIEEILKRFIFLLNRHGLDLDDRLGRDSWLGGVDHESLGGWSRSWLFLLFAQRLR